MNSNKVPSGGDISQFYQYQPNPTEQPLRASDEQRCCYPSKRCQNLRVMKRNGELHRLCEYHRTKANVNQRRLEQRRRMRSSQGSTTRSTDMMSNPDEDADSQRSSLPDISTADLADLESELQLLDEFLSQVDIELSPVNAGVNNYARDFVDGDTDVRMSI